MMNKFNTLMKLAQDASWHVCNYHLQQYRFNSNTIAVKSAKPAASMMLTQRQDDCARLLMKGLKYKEIARELELSMRTVETHINLLKDKLACRNKTELIIKLTNIF